jgi:acyl dehydratase
LNPRGRRPPLGGLRGPQRRPAQARRSFEVLCHRIDAMRNGLEGRRSLTSRCIDERFPNPTLPAFDTIAVGDELPVLQLPPVDRTTLALFAGASGDHNPIHIDIDVARRAGMPDVFAQGMLGMAWLGRMLTGWAPQSRLRRFEARFQGITHLGNAMRCSGRVVEKLEFNGERCVRIELQSANQFGQTKIAGEALVALP